MQKPEIKNPISFFFKLIEKQDPDYSQKNETIFLIFLIAAFPIHGVFWNIEHYPGLTSIELLINILFEILLYLPVIAIADSRIGRILERDFRYANGLLLPIILVGISGIYFLIGIPMGFYAATASFQTLASIFIPDTSPLVNLFIGYGLVLIFSTYGSMIAKFREGTDVIKSLWHNRRLHGRSWWILIAVMATSPFIVNAIGITEFWFIGPPIILISFLASQSNKLKFWRIQFNYADLFGLAPVGLLLVFASRITFFAYVPLVLIAVILFYHPKMKPLSRSHFFYRFSPNRNDVLTTLVTMGLLSITSLPLAVASGFLNIEDFNPKVTFFDLVNNGLLFLFKVATGEEVVFRCLLMTLLTNTFTHIKHLNKWPRTAALLFSSIIFGLGHAHGGLGYALVATIAGFAYGFLFLHQQSVFGVIILHAAIDTIAFCFFGAIARS